LYDSDLEISDDNDNNEHTVSTGERGTEVDKYYTSFECKRSFHFSSERQRH